MSTPTQTTEASAPATFNFYCPLELRKQLEAYSAETGAPLAEIVRRATAAWLQQQARPA